MAKTPKVKKREISIHSRAAKRGPSPPPPPNSLATKPPPQEADDQTWLYKAQNAGVAKKKKAKQLTRQQRLRQQRGLENAERNVDRLEKKVADSRKRSKKVRARAVEWEELNGRIAGRESRDGKVDVDADVDVDVDVVEETRREGAKEAAKEMEGVEMLDLEQPSSLHVAKGEDDVEPLEIAERENDVIPLQLANTEPTKRAQIEEAPAVEDLDDVR